MPLRLVVPTLWLALLGASIALSVLAGQHETLPGDTGIVSWAQDRAFPGHRLSDAVRAATATEAVLITGAVAVAVLALLGRRTEAVALGVALIALPLLQSSLKDLVDRPRPHEPLVDVRAGFSSESFPAGHVMSPTVLYAMLVWFGLRPGLPAGLRVPLAVWSAFVLIVAAPPNVWLGVHWPSDVLGGWAWAFVVVLPLCWAVELLRARSGPVVR